MEQDVWGIGYGWWDIEAYICHADTHISPILVRYMSYCSPTHVPLMSHFNGRYVGDMWKKCVRAEGHDRQGYIVFGGDDRIMP